MFIRIRHSRVRSKYLVILGDLLMRNFAKTLLFLSALAIGQAHAQTLWGPVSWSTQSTAVRSANGIYNAVGGSAVLGSGSNQFLFTAGTMRYACIPTQIPDGWTGQLSDYFPCVPAINTGTGGGPIDGTVTSFPHCSFEVGSYPAQFSSLEKSCHVVSSTSDPSSNTFWWIASAGTSGNYSDDTGGTIYWATLPSGVVTYHKSGSYLAGISPATNVSGTSSPYFTPVQVLFASGSDLLTLGYCTTTGGVQQLVIEHANTSSSTYSPLATYNYFASGTSLNTTPVQMAIRTDTAGTKHLVVIANSTDPGVLVYPPNDTGGPVGLLLEYTLNSTYTTATFESVQVYKGDPAFGTSPYKGGTFSALSVSGQNVGVGGFTMTAWHPNANCAALITSTGTTSSLGTYNKNYDSATGPINAVAWSADGSNLYMAGYSAFYRRVLVTNSADTPVACPLAVVTDTTLTDSGCNVWPIPNHTAESVPLALIADPKSGHSGDVLFAYRAGDFAGGPCYYVLYYVNTVTGTAHSPMGTFSNWSMDLNNMTTNADGTTIYLVGNGGWPYTTLSGNSFVGLAIEKLAHS